MVTNIIRRIIDCFAADSCTSVYVTEYISFAFNAVITIAIRLRYDYDPTTTYCVRLLHSTRFDASKKRQFFVVVVLVSKSNRTQIMISITSVVVECVVVLSYHSRIVVESQL